MCVQGTIYSPYNYVLTINASVMDSNNIYVGKTHVKCRSLSVMCGFIWVCVCVVCVLCLPPFWLWRALFHSFALSNLLTQCNNHFIFDVCSTKEINFISHELNFNRKKNYEHNCNYDWINIIHMNIKMHTSTVLLNAVWNRCG